MDMNSKQIFFVIGTDTDIGKTYVSSLFYKALLPMGCFYYKPIQSGCIPKDNQLIAPDVEFLCDMSGQNYDKTMVTYTLENPLSPHLASEIENININIDNIVENFEKLKSSFNFGIVEGAGGLLVPIIRDKFYIYDLIKKLDIPVIVVGSSRVGSINHNLLTIEALRSRDIKIAGIVFNRVNLDNIFEKDNIEIVTSIGNIDNYLVIKENQNSLCIDEIEKFIKNYSTKESL